ncbi:urea transport system ATP-binding protein [Pseudomonas sp. JUb42]|jgi:urea transport system ATP-binding protein|uniref:urea ABC transporter ATP-binding subunit UrtE n=1 Tax=Pseudomonas sp. JUb42 TaxID=2940611 RepID=UPI002166D335|nr:urea ABC transporter ATP-binding subunit UrtE [Pseudomonas sp. JUb42]MCS3472050.1 urea transport system ATP-binding protein [Pseudomonas sp. JUb42]
MLNVNELNVYYGQSHVLRNLSLQLAPAESLAIMGRNGMGKTTLLKSLVGMLPARSGSIQLAGEELLGRKSYQRVAAGIGFVPQGRMIFPLLTVEENIRTGMENTPEPNIPDYIFEYFPVLFEMRRRKGGNLSGGQQQQLAIARALVSNPKVLILDEPTEGIQPSIIKDIAQALNKLKKERGFSLIVSEQVLSFAMAVADRYLIIEKGEFVHSEVRETVDRERILRYLTI